MLSFGGETAEDQAVKMIDYTQHLTWILGRQ
jgi:hypothetical protein